MSANCYILCDEKTREGAVVDAGGYSDELEKEIKLSGMKELKAILCTHGHFDHVSGAAELKRSHPEAVVAIGAADAPLLSDSQKNLADYFGADYTNRALSAEKLFNDGDIFNIGDIKFRVLSTPGHTSGGVCYICDDEKLLFSGDTLFRLTAGRTDLYGGNFTELCDSLDRLMRLDDDYVVYTGHNIPTTIGYEREHNRYLRKRK